MGCTAFWWGIGGGMEIIMGYCSVESVGGGRTEKSYLSFSRVEYGLCTEILDSPRFLPILKGY